jgi:hypothetical protein
MLFSLRLYSAALGPAVVYITTHMLFSAAIVLSPRFDAKQMASGVALRLRAARRMAKAGPWTSSF